MRKPAFPGNALRRAVPGAVMLLAAALTSGCAYVTAQPVKPGDSINGIRIYDVKPLLVVSGENVTIQYVPNYNRAYALRFGAFLAKNDFEASISNGILTTVKANMDSTDFIEVLTALIEKIPGPGEGFSGPRQPRRRPAASRTASRSTTSSSTTTAIWSGCGRCSSTPNMLNVKTASAAQEFSGGPPAAPPVVVPQPGRRRDARPGAGMMAPPNRAANRRCARSCGTRNMRRSSETISRAQRRLLERYGAHHIGVSKKYRKRRRLPDTCITFYVKRKGKDVRAEQIPKHISLSYEGGAARADDRNRRLRDRQEGADRLQHARRQSRHRQ